jgi:hypothetical protein
MLMRGRPILSALVLCLVACWSAEADACKCRPDTLESYFENADIVLLAEVVRVATVTPDDGGTAFRSAEPRIVEAFKGADGIRSLQTPTSTASCGIDLEPGVRYWVFAQRRAGEPVAWINSCDGSRSADGDFSNGQAEEVSARLRELASVPVATPKPFTSPACWSAPRRYHGGAPPADIAQKITLERISPKSDKLSGVKSPNGAYAFAVQNPTRIQRPPRVATVTADVERDYLLELRLHGVAEPLEPQWVNEKLIFVRVAWDARSFTDVILDVEAEKLIYSEAAWAGETVFEERRGPCVPE